MSKSKNVNAVYDEYVQLRGQLLSNCNKMVETSTELNNIVLSVLKESSDTSELDSIKEEWIKSSSKIDSLKESIQTLQKEKSDIIKKMDTIIKKKGKGTTTDAKNLSNCQEEWVQLSTQISVLNTQLETFNKDRAKIIKKAETYFSKLDSSKSKKSPKKAVSKIEDKETSKKVVKKNESVIKKKSTAKKATKDEDVQVEVTEKPVSKSTKITTPKKTKVTKGTKGSKAEVDEDKEEKLKLQLDSDSDSESSESDTDSDLSSVESESDSDSDSDSESDTN